MNPAHILYKPGDADAPDCIKDSNGDIALGMCRVCRKAEVELDEPCDVALHELARKCYHTAKFDTEMLSVEGQKIMGVIFALLRRGVLSQWQPIESAPENEYVLLAREGERHRAIGVRGVIHKADFYLNNERVHWTGAGPTHWCRMLKAPGVK